MFVICLRILAFVFVCLQFFVAPPFCCPQPRWYYSRFSEIFDLFSSCIKQASSNVHVTELYAADPSMFELDGRHLKSFVGKDLIDHLLSCAESGMIKV